jgi:FkbM family methyltransferase
MNLRNEKIITALIGKMNFKFIIKWLLQKLLGGNNYLLLFYYFVLFRFKFNLLHNQEPEIYILKDYIKEGDLCLDIGANIGYYSAIMASYVGQSGQIVSFEPIKLNFKILHKVLHQKINIKLENKAVGEFNGCIRMMMPHFRGIFLHGTSHIISNFERIKNGDIEDVEIITLDYYCRSIKQRINFIKIDVEGYEYNVFKGGRETLKKHKPIILSELSKEKEETIKLLSELGYKTYGFLKNSKLISLEENVIKDNEIRAYIFLP